jgi:hypothetical protein
MARRAPNTTTTLEVSIMCEPSRLSPACVAQAYAEVGPLTPRIIARAAHLALARREKTLPSVGRRAVACPPCRPLCTPGSRRPNRPKPTPWRGRSWPCASVSPPTVSRCPRPCSASTQAIVGPPACGPRWSGCAMSRPLARWTGALSTRRIAWHATRPTKSCGSRRASMPESRSSA